MASYRPVLASVTALPALLISPSAPASVQSLADAVARIEVLASDCFAKLIGLPTVRETQNLVVVLRVADMVTAPAQRRKWTAGVEMPDILPSDHSDRDLIRPLPIDAHGR